MNLNNLESDEENIDALEERGDYEGNTGYAGQRNNFGESPDL